jgi:hypothetical protein
VQCEHELERAPVFHLLLILDVADVASLPGKKGRRRKNRKNRKMSRCRIPILGKSTLS